MEEDRCSFAPFQARKMENWQDQLMYPSLGSCIANVKQELSDKGCIFNQPSEEIQAPKTSWSQILPNSSPRSCVTTSFNSSMLDFSNNKPEPRHHQLDHSSQEVRIIRLFILCFLFIQCWFQEEVDKNRCYCITLSCRLLGGWSITSTLPNKVRDHNETFIMLKDSSIPWF